MVLISFSWVMLYETIPCFCYLVPGLKWRNQLLSPIMMLWRNSLPSAAYSSSNCKETFCWCLCSNRKWWAQQAQTFQYSKPSTTPWTTWRLMSICCHFSGTCPSSLISSLIFPLFLLVEGVHGQSLQVVRRCVFLSLKAFTNPMSLLVHMQASPYAQWICEWTSVPPEREILSLHIAKKCLNQILHHIIIWPHISHTAILLGISSYIHYIRDFQYDLHILSVQYVPVM